MGIEKLREMVDNIDNETSINIQRAVAYAVLGINDRLDTLNGNVSKNRKDLNETLVRVETIEIENKIRCHVEEAIRMEKLKTMEDRTKIDFAKSWKLLTAIACTGALFGGLIAGIVIALVGG